MTEISEWNRYEKEQSHVLHQYVHGVMPREESSRITRNKTVAVRVIHVEICRWF